MPSSLSPLIQALVKAIELRGSAFISGNPRDLAVSAARAALESAAEALEQDKQRLDWLETKSVVQVVLGSDDNLFTPDDDQDVTVRAAIDRARGGV